MNEQQIPEHRQMRQEIERLQEELGDMHEEWNRAVTKHQDAEKRAKRLRADLEANVKRGDQQARLAAYYHDKTMRLREALERIAGLSQAQLVDSVTIARAALDSERGE